jgi:phenylpyruvate tautomerase PptA (4-oxalocrotonate tautomerase family)
MPFIHVAWLPKACRTPEVRKEVASAIIKAVTAVNSAQITPDKVVVRFSEAVDGFALPPGHTHENVDLPVVKK